MSHYIFEEQLKICLKEINPRLVILFGSYAYGTPNEDSDLDILVVTNDDFTPSDFEEYSILSLKISKAIRPIKKQIAVDLIVYTIPMYNQFIKQDSLFSKEILTKGKIIYEGNHSAVA